MEFGIIKTGIYQFDIVTSDNRLFKNAGSELRRYVLNYSKKIIEGTMTIPNTYHVFEPQEKNPNRVTITKTEVGTKPDGKPIVEVEYTFEDVHCETCDYETEIKAAKEAGTLMAVTENGNLVIMDNEGLQFNYIGIDEYVEMHGCSKISMKQKMADKLVDALYYKKLVLLNEFYPIEKFMKHYKNSKMKKD